MRILVRGFDAPLTYPALERLAQDLKPEYMGLIHDPEHYPSRPAPAWGSQARIEELDFNDLVERHFPDSLHGSEPLSAALIETMAPCETVVLKMMDRLNPQRVPTYQARRALYLDYLRLCHHFLKSRKINVFIAHTIVHHPIDFILDTLCRRAGGVTIATDKVPVQGNIYLVDRWDQAGLEFKVTYEKMKAEGVSVTLRPEFSRHLEMQTGAEAPKYHHIESFFRSIEEKSSLGYRVRAKAKGWAAALRHRPLKVARSVATLEYFKRQRESLGKKSAELAAVYESLVGPVVPGEKFVFAPLHLQPEATTSPMGGVFVEQDLMLKLVSAVIPDDWVIYVKEHKAQGADGRTADQYHEMAQIPKVRFISKNEPAHPLVGACQMVATVAGTAGWEGLFRGKPVLLFGHNFYQYAPGLHRVDSLEACAAAMREILAGTRPDLGELKRFVGAIQEVSFPGYTEPRFGNLAGSEPEQNSSEIALRIAKRIRERV